MVDHLDLLEMPQISKKRISSAFIKEANLHDLCGLKGMVKATTLLSAALPCTAGMHKWAAVAPLAMASGEEAADLLGEPGRRL